MAEAGMGQGAARTSGPGLGIPGLAVALLVVGGLVYVTGAIIEHTTAYKEINDEDDMDTVRNLAATAGLLERIATFVAGAGLLVAGIMGRPGHAWMRPLYFILGLTLFFSGFPFHTTVSAPQTADFSFASIFGNMFG